MVTEAEFADLALQFQRKGNCGMRMAWLVSLPLALFVFALAGFLGLINFNIELHSVVMIGVIFLIWVFFLPHNAYYAACKLRRGFAKVKAELTVFINKNLLAIAGIEKANVPLDDFMAEAAASMRNENFSSVAAGIFPTLGILGTFISIAISMPDFSAQTSEVLEQEISKLLGGVGTAFYVSIYGIFLSIWWIFFEKSGVSRFERDAAIIKEGTRELFWGKEEIEQTYFRKSMENFEKLNTVFDSMASQDFIESLNTTLEQRMHIFEKIIEHEQKAAAEMEQLIDRTGTAVQRLSQQQDSMSTALQSMSTRLEQFAQGMEQQGVRMAQMQDALSQEYKSGVAVAETLSGNIAKLNEVLGNISAENVHELYSGVIANIEQMKHEIDQIGEQFDLQIKGFDAQFIEKLRQTLTLIDSETARIIEQIAQIDKREDIP